MTTANVPMPIRRDLRFDLPPERIADWNKGSVHLSHFMNTMSLFFPDGERFFIDAVRQYRDRITDPELKKAVTAFIGQEAMHGREHEDYNDALIAQVPEAAEMIDTVKRLLAFLQKKSPAEMRLSATIALEHLTAILANGLLSDERMFEGMEPKYAALWRWHALEETEHKAVAYDVWAAVMKPGPRAYLSRTGGFVVANLIFWSLMVPFYVRILKHEGKLADLAGWRVYLKETFTEKKFFPKLAGPWLAYFKPRFHPWQHDNRQFLTQIPQLTAALAAA